MDSRAFEQSVAVPTKTSQLTVQEIRVLELICRGLSNKMIARSLQIAPETVKSHVKHILAKLNVNTRAAAVWQAKGLILI